MSRVASKRAISDDEKEEEEPAASKRLAADADKDYDPNASFIEYAMDDEEDKVEFEETFSQENQDAM